jgi:hypothetical protein
MKHLLLATLLLVVGWSTTHAQETAYSGSRSFAAFRNGERIGTHKLDFQRDGNRLIVTTSIDLAVKMVGFTAYRYTHRSREVWVGDSLLALESSTDDDSKPYAVKVARDGESLVVARLAPGAKDWLRETLPAGILPSTHWNMRQTRQLSLLNSQKGTVEKISVAPLGRDPAKTATGTVEATRYHYEGGIRMDQWFDSHGRWVKMSFPAPDGSSIDYVLQDTD